MGFLSDKTRKRKAGVTPLKMVLYGVPKVGKTRFACDAPSPYFILTERDGITRNDVSYINPESMADVNGVIAELAAGGHEYRTLVIDSFDWLEPLLYEELCRNKNWPSVAEAPYGKGYQPANEVCRGFLSALDKLQHRTDMNVIVIAHPAVKKVANTGGTDYIQTGLKLLEGSNCDVSRTVTEWATVIGYAKFDITTKKEEMTRLAKVTMDERASALLCFGPAADFVCGSRYPLPSEIPLDWKTFWKHYVSAMPVSDDEAKAGLQELLPQLTPDEQKAVKAYVADGDLTKIKATYNRIKEKLNV